MPWVIGAALVGVVISFYYYFTVIREIFWGKGRFWAEKLPPLSPCPARAAEVVLLTCLFGLIGLGLFPEPILYIAGEATEYLFSAN